MYVGISVGYAAEPCRLYGSRRKLTSPFSGIITQIENGMVLIKDFVIPSVMKLTAGSGTAVYREGQDLPLIVSRRLKKLAVVDLPEVRKRQVSWVWLGLWILTVVALGAILVSLVSAL